MPHFHADQILAKGAPAFVTAYGDLFEHSPWIAERAYHLLAKDPKDTNLADLFRRTLRALGRGEQLALLRAHPTLAGRRAQAGRLSTASQCEQKAAGLDRITEAEQAFFTAANHAYLEFFAFPFILAVRGRGVRMIAKVLQQRLKNTAEQEFTTALHEVTTIALGRLDAKARPS